MTEGRRGGKPAFPRGERREPGLSPLHGALWGPRGCVPAGGVCAPIPLRAGMAGGPQVEEPPVPLPGLPGASRLLRCLNTGWRC